MIGGLCGLAFGMGEGDIDGCLARFSKGVTGLSVASMFASGKQSSTLRTISRPTYLRSAVSNGSILSRRALDFVFPPRCPVTQSPVAVDGDMSAEGWRQLIFIDDPVCARCGMPFVSDFGVGVDCPLCLVEPPDFDSARAAVLYNDAAHDLIVAFKYSDRTDLAGVFTKWMARAGAGLISERSVLMPVPLHPRRLFSRRYNQSALLAKRLAGQFGADLRLDDLYRHRATVPQQSLSTIGRRRNVAGAFTVRPERITRLKGAHIVLIDDVLTTGATLSAISKTLKRCGAARVDALAVARVVKHGVATI